ncbi:hypothetical protein ACFX2H_014434 [Malus domestica]
MNLAMANYEFQESEVIFSMDNFNFETCLDFRRTPGGFGFKFRYRRRRPYRSHIPARPALGPTQRLGPPTHHLRDLRRRLSHIYRKGSDLDLLIFPQK